MRYLELVPELFREKVLKGSKTFSLVLEAMGLSFG